MRVKKQTCMWHPLISRNLGSASKELRLSYWWWCIICYGWSGPHGCVSLNCKTLASNVALLFFSVKHVSPHWQAFISPLLAQALAVNCISSMSKCWRCLPTSWCPCPLHSCAFCRCPWSEDEITCKVGDVILLC